MNLKFYHRKLYPNRKVSTYIKSKNIVLVLGSLRISLKKHYFISDSGYYRQRVSSLVNVNLN